MGDVANRDDAQKCLQIAEAALAAGDLDKAQRFAEKAMKLFPNEQADLVLRVIRGRRNGAAGPSSSTSQPGAPTAAAASAQPGLHRRGAARASAAQPPPADKSTPEMRELVRKILATKDFYNILSVSKDAGDDDIKKAYRKLALKLHPDKNTARGADEAFKAVSKAFSCLSDPDQRAAYDRYGEEGAPLSRARANGHYAQQGFTEFDAEELFNMFFNGGVPRPGGMHFHTNFGGAARGRAPAGEQPPTPYHVQLLHLAPILLLLLFTFLNHPSPPVTSLDQGAEYVDQIHTKLYNVPYYVKARSEYDRQYPPNTQKRLALETEVELGYKERLTRHCYEEQQVYARLRRWGQQERAAKMPLTHCKELREKFGNVQFAHSAYAY